MSVTSEEIERLERIRTEALVPLHREICRILIKGQIAVVVFEPDASMLGFIDHFGGRRTTATHVFALPKKRARELAAEFSEIHEPSAVAWLTRSAAHHRIVILNGNDARLLNLDIKTGRIWLEPRDAALN